MAKEITKITLVLLETKLGKKRNKEYMYMYYMYRSFCILNYTSCLPLVLQDSRGQ